MCKGTAMSETQMLLSKPKSCNLLPRPLEGGKLVYFSLPPNYQHFPLPLNFSEEVTTRLECYYILAAITKPGCLQCPKKYVSSQEHTHTHTLAHIRIKMYKYIFWSSCLVLILSTNPIFPPPEWNFGSTQSWMLTNYFSLSLSLSALLCAVIF